MIGRTAGERGSSLIEMVTVVALLSVVLGATFVSLTSFQNTSAGVDERLENLSETRFVMDTLTQDIRSATRPASDPETGAAFTVAGPTTLSFLANLRTVDEVPREVTLSVDGEGLLRRAEVGAGGDRVIGGYITTDQGPLFTYLDGAGAPIVPADPSGMLTVDERKAVRSVQIVLRVRKDPNPRAPATEVQTLVRLPNLPVESP